MFRPNQQVFAFLAGIVNIVNILIYISGVIMLVVFFWGLVKFLTRSSEESLADGRRLMVWGIVSFFVLFSLWGIVYFVQGNLNIKNANVESQQKLPGFFILQ